MRSRILCTRSVTVSPPAISPPPPAPPELGADGAGWWSWCICCAVSCWGCAPATADACEDVDCDDGSPTPLEPWPPCPVPPPESIASFPPARCPPLPLPVSGACSVSSAWSWLTAWRSAFFEESSSALVCTGNSSGSSSEHWFKNSRPDNCSGTQPSGAGTAGSSPFRERFSSPQYHAVTSPPLEFFAAPGAAWHGGPPRSAASRLRPSPPAPSPAARRPPRPLPLPHRASRAILAPPLACGAEEAAVRFAMMTKEQFL